MAVNITKLIVAGAVVVACVVALIIDADAAASWAVPVLGVLVGYIAGNAQLTDRTGTTAPVVSTKE